MKICVIFCLILSPVFSLFSYNSRVYSYYLLENRSFSEIADIQRVEDVSVVGMRGDSLFIEATCEGAQALHRLGFPLSGIDQDIIFGNTDNGYYHTWTQVQSEIASYISSHPGIAKCDTIGYSVQNRPILRVKISDNPGSDELEGRIQFNGCHHGNEKISTEINLYFMRFLCDNYGTLPWVTSLVDSREIFFIPVVNPDGFVLNQRRNANNIDINRDYGYQWFNESGAANPFSEPETRAMREDFASMCYSISLDYHSVSEYVNYLWDYSSRVVPDWQEEVVMFSVPYADSTGYDTINGYSWYQVSSSCQDATYGLFGTLAVTIESQQPSDPDPECLKNLGAMVYVTKLSGHGINGYVLDSFTGQPLEAVLFFKKGSDPKWTVNSRVLTGDYQKILSPGTYQVTAHAPGYASKTINVQVYADTSSGQDFLLNPSENYFGVRMMCARQEYSNFTNTTHSFNALGPADGIGMSLNRLGYAIIDFGENFPVLDGPGYDLIVHEAQDGITDSCFVYIGNSPEYAGTWHYLGKISGNDSFDIASTGLTQARYVKIMDDGSTTSGSTPGYDLDAVHAINSSNSVEEPLPEIPVYGNNLSFYLAGNFLPLKTLYVFNPENDEKILDIAISDVSGRMVFSGKIKAMPGQNYFSVNEMLPKNSRSGIFYLSVRSGYISESFKMLNFR
ncbi:carboxypeptidase regulatory-like domain-containing protein [candidate division WOR-3 bacterium]|nr:carboxypeptidase regulatory-like domain-containing protein [candidate division WOR-3 bacterium]